MKKKKPTMPSHSIKQVITQPVSVELWSDLERFNNGNMMMSITSADIKTYGQKVGEIRFCMSGATVGCSLNGRFWGISILELWPIFAAADEQYKKGEKA